MPHHIQTSSKLFISGLLSLILSGCGGGGGGGTNAPLTGGTSPTQLCAAPRTGIDPATGVAYPDKAGSVASEKAWVGGFMTDTYLWYNELPTLSASNYPTPVAYFNALKTPATTASGRAKDQFHFTYPSAVWYAQSQLGQNVEYGIAWAFVSSTAPRNVVVKMVEPSSSASSAQVTRGMTLLTVDGIDVVNTQSPAAIDSINAALFPSAAGQSHVLTFRTLTGSTFTANLSAGVVTSAPVPLVKTITTATGKVGYIQFNEHISTAQPALINAFTTLKNANINQLVIDLRYNGGGYLNMASQVAYMVAPQASTSGKTFERLAFNDKNPSNLTAAETTLGFFNTSLNYGPNGGAAGQALPNLGLSRVYVLTSSNTASASESIINGLRGVDVPVHIIGSATRGKPYGFSPEENCGTTYFAIQFQGVNQKGFGDYADGFAPTCAAVDDFTKPLGDVTEKSLAQALYHQTYGTCSTVYQKPTGTTVAVKAMGLSLAPDAREDSPLKMRRDLSKFK
jgi:carboxyl-terminal processing protease